MGSWNICSVIHSAIGCHTLYNQARRRWDRRSIHDDDVLNRIHTKINFLSPPLKPRQTLTHEEACSE